MHIVEEAAAEGDFDFGVVAADARRFLAAVQRQVRVGFFPLFHAVGEAARVQLFRRFGASFAQGVHVARPA